MRRWGLVRGMPGSVVMRRQGRVLAWPGDRRGLALLVMVFAIVIVAAVVSVGYMAAGQQFRVGVGGRQGSSAFYAAEAGLSGALAGWDSTAATLQPGATLGLASERLSSGAAFEVTLTRIDPGLDDSVAHYLMVSTGWAEGPWGGRRQVALFLRARNPNRFCCASALATSGGVVVGDGAVISGFDRIPEVWTSTPAVCDDSSTASGPGVSVYGEGSLTESTGAEVLGLPATRRRAEERADFLTSVDRWFADLTELTDSRLPAGAVVDRIEPAVGLGGSCDRTVSWNWGAPEAPDHPCFDYLPIIHAHGDLHIATAGSGQGVLLVEGDLVIGGGFQFFGVVVVRGSARISGEGTRLSGALIVFDSAREGSEVTSRARIDLSSCPLQRALRGPKLYLPHPLAEFAWLEILE